MLGNIKNMLLNVQDSITSNNNLRQTLQEVQKVKYIFREKSKAPQEAKINYSAGSEILNKYEEAWKELHNNLEENAVMASNVDKIIIEVNSGANSRLVHARDLAHGLTNLPKLSASIYDCVDSLKEVQSLITTVEEELANLEELIESSHLARKKIEYHNTLNLCGIPKRGPRAPSSQLTLEQIQIEDDHADLDKFLNS